jgi:hypothetical protein
MRDGFGVAYGQECRTRRLNLGAIFEASLKTFTGDPGQATGSCAAVRRAPVQFACIAKQRTGNAAGFAAKATAAGKLAASSTA